mgnify:CR=1 FL=1
MEEVEIICDRVIILDKGKVLATGTTDELKELAKIEEKVTCLYNSLFWNSSFSTIAMFIISNFSLFSIFEKAILKNVPNIIGKANVQLHIKKAKIT